MKSSIHPVARVRHGGSDAACEITAKLSYARMNMSPTGIEHAHTPAHRARAWRGPHLLMLLIASAFWPASFLRAADEEAPAASGAWDTGQASAEPLAPAVRAAREAWTAILKDKTVDSFTGDAVISNGRLVAVQRKRSAAVELYAFGPAGSILRSRLLLLAPGGAAAARLVKATLVENTKGGLCLEASYTTSGGEALSARFRLKKGEPLLETEPLAGAEALRVEVPCRFLVLPDFFADDIVIDAAKLPAARAELPSENFLVHLSGPGDSIAVCVFENREQEVSVTLAGEGDRRTVTGTEIRFGKGRKIWTALLEGPQLWHTRDIRAEDGGTILPLGWKMPFPACWRADFTRTDELTDTWEMLLQQKEGAEYQKPVPFGGGSGSVPLSRKRWTTVLGSTLYPCWSDHESNAFLQPLKHEALTFRGPAVFYPLNRVQATPLDVYTVVDIMRSSLGVGPCEYILDLEGQKSAYKGRATCSTRDTLEPIYDNGQQRQKREEIEQVLDEVIAFVAHIRSRIEGYVAFGHALQEYLAEQAKAHPELKGPLAELGQLTRQIDARVEARRAKIKTVAHVKQMVEEFRRSTLAYEGADALVKCKAFTRPLVEIGGNQDELVGECRWVVKSLRQKAGLLLATEPRLAGIAAELRTRTQAALNNPANHEGARH
jgi:hypothetical protein